MACVFWQDECKTKGEELMKKIKSLKECENEDGDKGKGSVREISRLMKNFKDR